MLEGGVDPGPGQLKLGDYAQTWLDDEMRPRYDAEGNRFRGVWQASFENYARDARWIRKYLGEARLDQLRVRMSAACSCGWPMQARRPRTSARRLCAWGRSSIGPKPTATCSRTSPRPTWSSARSRRSDAPSNRRRTTCEPC